MFLRSRHIKSGHLTDSNSSNWSNQQCKINNIKRVRMSKFANKFGNKAVHLCFWAINNNSTDSLILLKKYKGSD